MHGTYMFLSRYKERDVERAYLITETKFHEDYAYDNFNEENWYSPIALLFKNGAMIMLGSTNAEDDNTVAEFTFAEVNKIFCLRKKDRWGAAMKFATQRALETPIRYTKDLGMNTGIFTKTLEPRQLVKSSINYIPKVILSALSKRPRDFWIIEHLAKTALLLESSLDNENSPFSRQRCSPDWYSCFDLTTEEDKGMLGIYFVDIHT